MELKLNVYNDNDEIVKTYTTQSFRIKLKVLNNFINIMDSTRLSFILKSVSNANERDNEEFVTSACELLNESRDLFYDLFKSVFKGLTDEELGDCYTDELVALIGDLSKFAVRTIGLGSKTTEKN